MREKRVCFAGVLLRDMGEVASAVGENLLGRGYWACHFVVVLRCGYSTGGKRASQPRLGGRVPAGMRAEREGGLCCRGKGMAGDFESHQVCLRVCRRNRGR